MKKIYERVRIEIIVCDDSYETCVLSISNGGEVDEFGYESGGGSGGDVDDFD